MHPTPPPLAHPSRGTKIISNRSRPSEPKFEGMRNTDCSAALLGVTTLGCNLLPVATHPAVEVENNIH